MVLEEKMGGANLALQRSGSTKRRDWPSPRHPTLMGVRTQQQLTNGESFPHRRSSAGIPGGSPTPFTSPRPTF